MIASLASAVRKWIVPSSSGHHWDAMDGLRGIAILMVVACHGFYANPQGPAWTRALGNFIGSGALGVQMFFVLSGFLIAHPFFSAKLKDPAAWYPQGYGTRRCLKIFPPYYLVIMLLLIWYLGRYGGTGYLTTALQWAVGIPHLFYVNHPFNGSFWSLWVELGFYGLLPVFFWLLRRWNLGGTTVVIAAALLAVPFLSRSLNWPAPGRENWYLVYVGGRFPNGLTNFAWGVLFAGWFTATRTQPRQRLARLGYVGAGLLATTLALQAVIATRGLSGHGAHELVLHLCGAATFLLLFFVLDPSCIGARVLSAPVLRYLGLVSYEWFLLHQPMINEFRSLMGSAGGSLPRYLLIVLTPVVLSLGGAMLIYHHYSIPIIRWGRDRLGQQKQQVEAGQAKAPTAANS